MIASDNHSGGGAGVRLRKQSSEAKATQIVGPSSASRGASAPDRCVRGKAI